MNDRRNVDLICVHILKILIVEKILPITCICVSENARNFIHCVIVINVDDVAFVLIALTKDMEEGECVVSLMIHRSVQCSLVITSYLLEYT